jgi:hypothetical protein
MSRGLSCLSWNIAAVNNNPFEYYITSSDSQYDELMQAVEQFVENPGDGDVPVSAVFTPAMFAELKSLMLTEGWSGIDATEKYWCKNIRDRKIMSEFIKDKVGGRKSGLTATPDRLTT